MLMLLIAGCSPTLMIPSIKDAENATALGSTITVDELLEAHKLYKNKCGGCHFLYRPYQFTIDKWKSVMPDMKVEAKLNEEEYRLLYNYVMAMQSNKPLK